MELIERRMLEMDIKTQKKLSELTGVSVATINRLFNGRSLSADNAYKILKGLGLIVQSDEPETQGEGEDELAPVQRIDCLDRRAHSTYFGKFNNRQLAIELSRDLLELEGYGEEHLLDLKRDIDSRIRALRIEKNPIKKKAENL